MQSQPLTPTRRNTKSIPLSAKSKQESITVYTTTKCQDTIEIAESPKKPLATITNRAVRRVPDSPERKKTGRQSKTSSPVTTPKSRVSAASPNCVLPASPLSKRTLDLQHDLFQVYQDSVSHGSPETPRNLPVSRRRSIGEADSSLEVTSSLELDGESRYSIELFQELEQKLEQQTQDNERLRKELNEEKSQRKALEEDHKLQDEFIKALEKQLTEIKLSSQAKCQSLERELAESNELLEECRALLEEVQHES